MLEASEENADMSSDKGVKIIVAEKPKVSCATFIPQGESESP